MTHPNQHNQASELRDEVIEKLKNAVTEWRNADTRAGVCADPDDYDSEGLAEAAEEAAWAWDQAASLFMLNADAILSTLSPEAPSKLETGVEVREKVEKLRDRLSDLLKEIEGSRDAPFGNTVKRKLHQVFTILKEDTDAILALDLSAVGGWRPKDEAQRLFLWALLDEIDTASDIFKDDYEGLAKFVYRKAQERHKIAHSDGHRLVFNDITPLVQPGDGDLMRFNATAPSPEREGD